MQRSSDASQFPELLQHQRASDTVVYSICYNDFWMCKLTMPRWGRYAAWHHIDHVVLRGEANAGNASLASRTRSQWHKFVLTRHFFELGYEWLLFADADTAPIQWRHSVASWTNLKSSDLTGAHLKPDHKEFGAGNTTELVISRDRGHPGFYGPPIGPTNTGVWLLKNGSLARSLFDWQWDCAHHISCSVKDSNSFNTDQSSMNRWFWKHVYTGQDRHRATLLKYCFGPRRMQCELHGHGSARALIAELFKPNATLDWRSGLATAVLAINASNAWILHTLALVETEDQLRIQAEARAGGGDEPVPSMREYIGEAIGLVERLLPIPHTRKHGGSL